MLGKQSGPDGDGHSYLDHVGRDSFYGFLASHREELFSDEDFAGFYCPDNGRPSVPPSLSATAALLLQTYEGVSDEEAKARADFDLRWKVALGIGLEERPFAKSAPQLFRARLTLHERMQTLFRGSLDFARHTGCLRSRRLKVVLDTSHILGRGAVRDTCNLLADGIVKLARELAARVHSDPERWAQEHGLGRYFGLSLKGEAGIDWDDPEARGAFLESVAGDADRLLAAAREATETFPADDPGRGRLHEAAALLERLLLQDIERLEDGTRIKQGASPDRIVSVHDPEMRHGRKSERRRFDGHEAHLAVDPGSQLITAADILAGNAADHERALELVEQAEANTGSVVEETIGDCAYGSGGARKTFVEAGRRLTAKAATRRGGAQSPKEDFLIDLESMSCVCPAGQRTQKVVSISSGDRYGAPGVPLRAFRFDAAGCDACPLRPSCMRARLGKGRLVMIHPQEALLREARAFQESEALAPYRKLRQAAEHRLARLMQPGVRQARYFGRTKTFFQLLMAATVANLTLVATRVGIMRDRNHPRTTISMHVYALFVVRRVFAALMPRPEPGFSATLLEQIDSTK